MGKLDLKGQPWGLRCSPGQKPCQLLAGVRSDSVQSPRFWALGHPGPGQVSKGVGTGLSLEAPSALHAVAVEVAQQQSQLQAHDATRRCVQAVAVSPAVDGVPVQQLRAATHEGPRQLLPPAAQGPPCGAVQLVGAWTAGHVAKAIACKLTAAEAVLRPHLEMEPGPACRMGAVGRKGAMV